MVMNVIELRQNRWLPRKGVDQGPKKLAEIHNEIKREQMENQIQRDQVRLASVGCRGSGSA